MNRKQFSITIAIFIIVFATLQCNAQTRLAIGNEDNSSSIDGIDIFSNGDILIGGTSINYGPGFFDFWIARMDTLGDTLWSKTYGNTESNYREELVDITVTSDGGFIAIGPQRPGIIFDYVASYVVRGTGTGDTLWTRLLQGVEIIAIAQTSDGGFILTGYTLVGFSQMKGCILKLDSQGNPSWGYSIQSSASSEAFSEVIETVDSGFAFVGYASEGSWSPSQAGATVLKLDKNGTLLWSTALGYWAIATSSSYGSSIIEFNNGELLVLGTLSYSSINSIYMIRLRPNGTAIKVNELSFAGKSVNGTSLIDLNDGSVFLTSIVTSSGSYFNNILNIHFDTSGVVLGSTIINDSSYWKVQPILAYTGKIWLSTDIYNGSSLVIGLNENFRACHDSAVSISSINSNTLSAVYNPNLSALSTGSNYNSLVSTGPNTSIVCEYITSTSTLGNEQETFTIYPNPTDGMITIMNLPQESTRITIYNTLGALIYVGELNGSDNPVIDLTGFPKGLYYLQVFAKGRMLKSKIIKL